MSEIRSTIMPLFHNGEDLVRANYFGSKGSSSKTCRTPSEAQGFINACKAKDSK